MLGKHVSNQRLTQTVGFTNGEARLQRNISVSENGKSVNSQEPASSPANPLVSCCCDNPRRLAQLRPATARGKAWRSWARLRGQRAGGSGAGQQAARRSGRLGAQGNPSRALTSPERWPMRSRRGGFPLQLPPPRLFKLYSGDRSRSGGRSGENGG